MLESLIKLLKDAGLEPDDFKFENTNKEGINVFLHKPTSRRFYLDDQGQAYKCQVFVPVPLAEAVAAVTAKRTYVKTLELVGLNSDEWHYCSKSHDGIRTYRHKGKTRHLYLDDKGQAYSRDHAQYTPTTFGEALEHALSKGEHAPGDGLRHDND